MRHGIQYARHLLLVVMLASALMLAPPAASTAAGVSPRAASAQVQSYSAWSCRGVYHVVRRGETIYSIARRYGSTAYRIAVCNGLASYTVYVGQTLLVPMGR